MLSSFRLIAQLALVLFAVLLASCESISYYSQAASGQMSIVWQRQDIEKLITDPKTEPVLRSRLELVLSLRRFAEEELLLPAGEQYSKYVELGRPHVVWNVFASPALSLEPETWCFPIAGCAAYRGYFKEEAARRYAKEYAERGFDTYVGGVSAYSTLGWLNDPVLSTFVHWREAELADLLFHELAHQLLYIPGDTLFNESFATAVAREGVKRWMARPEMTAGYESYLKSRQQQEEFVAFLAQYRTKLGELYDSALADEAKRVQKQVTLEQLEVDFKTLQNAWGDREAYSAWMSKPVNNARLNSVALYFDLVPALEQLLGDKDNDLLAFYSYLDNLSDVSTEQRHRQIERRYTPQSAQPQVPSSSGK